MKTFDLIGAELGWGAKTHETQWGPKTLKDYDIEQFLFKINPRVKWRSSVITPTPYVSGMQLNYQERLIQVSELSQQLAKEVKRSVNEKHFPLVLGGDHSIAIGTWSGMVDALSAYQNFGLIWVDAHMDSHTPKTTLSHAIHGMPLAGLLGYGEPSLTQLSGRSPKLNPQQVVLIGVRSFEKGEAELLARLNVKIYFMDDVKKLGIQTVFSKAVEQVSKNVKGFGVSLDLDAFDPGIAPGTGAPVPGGLDYEAVAVALKEIARNPLFCALEIAEFDPTRDINNKTFLLLQNLLACVVNYG